MAKSFRYLRIAFSAFCGIAAVLLIALWGRSYAWDDSFNVHVPFMNWLGINSNRGSVKIFVNTMQSLPWEFVTEPAHDRLDAIPNNYGFALQYNRPSLYVRIPHWLCVLVAAVFAVMPWVRIRWRFSLRTLLIVTTLVALLFGLFVWQR